MTCEKQLCHVVVNLFNNLAQMCFHGARTGKPGRLLLDKQAGVFTYVLVYTWLTVTRAGPGLDLAMFRKRMHLPTGHDEMVEDAHVHQRERLHQRARE